MTERPNIVGPEYIAALLHRKLSTVRVDARRKPESLPPRLQIPGVAKLLWVEADVLEWVNSLRPQAKKKSGRPSQVSQLSPQA
jgi:predicted DNA-binding transcriptional regulator AlpA